MACHVTKINNNDKQPTKQEVIIPVNRNLKAFEAVDCTCTVLPISDKSRFTCAHVWSVCVNLLFFNSPCTYSIKHTTYIWTALSMGGRWTLKMKLKKDTRLIPFSQCSPSNPGGHKHRYPIGVNPDWQVALFWHWELLSQAFWRRKNETKRNNERKMEGLNKRRN